MFYNYKRKLPKSDVGSTTLPLRRREVKLGDRAGVQHVVGGVGGACVFFVALHSHGSLEKQSHNVSSRMGEMGADFNFLWLNMM